MTRPWLYRITRIVGEVSWWVFVVAVLLGEATAAGPMTSSLVDRQGCVPGDSVQRLCLSTANSPDTLASHAMDPYVTAALALVVLAALIEAVVAGRLVPGLVTVAAPILAAVMIIDTLHRNWWWQGGFAAAKTLAIIVAAIAIREVWAHVLAPGVTARDTDTSTSPEA
ncbi:hypothetical protein [Nocardia sp. NPDC020380]|uniref:hypothetical protein n=1 Tax=Nocardia sp. NPDC020380 TaxID=3364309 RepID=UPI003788638D